MAKGAKLRSGDKREGKRQRGVGEKSEFIGGLGAVWTELGTVIPKVQHDQHPDETAMGFVYSTNRVYLHSSNARSSFSLALF
jgi:hypothetical protein